MHSEFVNRTQWQRDTTHKKAPADMRIKGRQVDDRQLAGAADKGLSFLLLPLLHILNIRTAPPALIRTQIDLIGLPTRQLDALALLD